MQHLRLIAIASAVVNQVMSSTGAALVRARGARALELGACLAGNVAILL
jgi:hypothetical protein